jgi:hypothetical protein
MHTVSGCPSSFPELKQPECEVKHSSPCTVLPLSAIMAWTGKNFPFYLINAHTVGSVFISIIIIFILCCVGIFLAGGVGTQAYYTIYFLVGMFPVFF